MPSEDSDQPRRSDVDPPTLPPSSAGNADDATLPPQPGSPEEQTIPPKASANGNGATVGDQIRYFGDYELVEEIARGGMGVVYRARQTNLNRIVALKMILAGQFAGQEDVQRFYTEAEAAAQLDHPGIVPIFEIGEHQGQHYFSMAYVQGESLGEKVADGPLRPLEAAAIVRSICTAMAYAHERGVIHRDLKPANILLDANGQPKVTDFGLAKKTSGDSGLTGTGQILGTPAYMPPEQASGSADDVGPLADVYSLGAILYCLVTGRPPFQAASPMDTLLQVLEQDPVSPRQLNRDVSKDLETICLKCLDKHPQRRYASAQDLADELQRLLEGSPIKARPVGRVTRLWRWRRRHPWKAATAAAMALVLFLLAIGGPTIAVRESQLRFVADRASYGNRVQLAEREWKIGQVANAVRALEECPEEMRGWEWNHVSRLCQQETLKLEGHTAGVNDVAFHPDGHQLASASYDGNVILWNLHTVQPTHTLKHENVISRVAYSPDGKRLATGGRQGNVQLWDTESGTLIRKLEGHSEWVRSVAFSPNGKQVASASYDKTCKVWDVETGKLIHTLTGHTNLVKGVAFHPGGKLLVTAGEDSTIRLWDLDSGEQLRVLRGHRAPIVSVEFNFTGDRIVTASSDQSIRLWDTDTGRMVQMLKGHKHVVKIAQFSPDGRHVVSAGIDRTIRIWDLQTGTSTKSYSHRTGSVEGACYSPDGRWIASSGDDGIVRIWDTQQSEARILEDNSNGVGGLAFAGNKRLVTAAGHGGRLWLPDSGWVVGEPFWHRQDAFCVAVDSTGKRSASGGQDSHINVWDIDQHSLIQTLPRGNGNVISLAFSPDDRFLVAGCSNNIATIFDLESGETRELQHDGGVFRVVFDDQGKLFTASTGKDLSDRKLTAWNFDSGEKISEQRIDRLREIAINLVHRQIWVADQWGNLIAFSIDRPFKFKLDRWGAHSSSITGLAVSQDGTRIASGDQNGILKLWDATTAEPVLSLNEHSEEITAIAFSPNDRWLASASNRGKIRLRDSVIQMDSNQKAHWIVNALIERSYDIDRLEREINELPTISEDVRQAALDYAASLKASPDAWLAESGKTVTWSGSSPAVYQRAHRQARAAIQSGQSEPWAYWVLAMAEYRLGRYEQAEQSLRQLDQAANEGAFEMPSVIKAMVLHRLGRQSEARIALAGAWGSINSRLMLVYGDETVQSNRRLLNEAKQELFGDDVLELESVWAPRVGREFGIGGVDAIHKVLQSVAAESDAASELVPYLIAEQLVGLASEQESVTSHLVDRFQADSNLPDSVREIAIAMAKRCGADPNHLYAESLVLLTPGLPDQTYQKAAEQADELMAIVRVFPKGSQAMGRLIAHQGFARYRMDRLEECVELIHRATEMPMGQTAFSEAILAMANHRLGNVEEARRFLPEIPKFRNDLKSSPNHLLLPLLDEVEEVLGVVDESHDNNPGKP